MTFEGDELAVLRASTSKILLVALWLLGHIHKPSWRSRDGASRPFGL